MDTEFQGAGLLEKAPSSEALAAKLRPGPGVGNQGIPSLPLQGLDSPLAPEAPRPAAQAASVAKAIETVQQLGERLQTAGRERATLRLVLDDGTSLTVRLLVRNDTVQAAFRVESQSLQQALQMHWTQLSRESGDRDLRFLEPVFEQAGSETRERGDDRNDRRETAVELPCDWPVARSENSGRKSMAAPPERSHGWHAWA